MDGALFVNRTYPQKLLNRPTLAFVYLNTSKMPLNQLRTNSDLLLFDLL